MKRKIFLFILILLFCPAIVLAEYWASKNSNKYHRPNCEWARKINPKNLIKFKTKEEAQKAGYIPCKVCKP